MSVHFEKIPIKDIQQETGNCISLSFNIPPNLFEAFQYKPGQHLTLRAFINGAEVRRSYSLCSSPLENEWRIAIKKAEEGLFSTHAHEHLKPGDIIEVMPPAGNFFTPLNAANKKHYVAFAAGSGITPVFSLIKTILQTEPQSQVTLVYGNRDRQSIIFLEALEALKNIYMQRFSLIHILSREATEAKINSGRIDEEKCEILFDKVIPAPADEFFICGPEEMIFYHKKFLLSKNIGRKNSFRTFQYTLFNSSKRYVLEKRKLRQRKKISP